MALDYDFSHLQDRTWYECADGCDIFEHEEEADMCWNVDNWPDDVKWQFNYQFIDVSNFWGRIDG